MRTLNVCAKVADCFSASLVIDGKEVKDYDGYVPKLMPEEHYGDYIQIDIDIDTGQILNWKKPTEEQIKEFIGEED